MPLRSDDALAAVADAFGTVSVLDSVMWMHDIGIFKTRLAT